MIDNKTIREDCRIRMEADRLAITKELGLVQKDRPWIAITVKTKQAIRATLNGMAEAMLELKVSGNNLLLIKKIICNHSFKVGSMTQNI